MNKLIELYAGIIAFFASVLIILGIIAININYRPASDMAATLVDMIEIHEGMTEAAKQQTDELIEKVEKFTVDIQQNEEGDYKSYTVKVSSVLIIPILKLEIPIETEKTTKRCLF